MKIEASKNHQHVEHKDSKNVFKSDPSVFTTADALKQAHSAPASSNGAFAKILEETRKENDKDLTTSAKSDSGDDDAKTAKKAEKDEKVNRAADEKRELDERDSQNGDGDARQDADDNQTQSVALAALQSPNKASAETNAPAARSILHVADLERIVSTVRTETFQNQKQITIELKNSVLEGLQIRLTLDESGKLKAEFLALNEQIKKQLIARKPELSEILKNRSAMFAEVEVKSRQDSSKTA